MKPFDIADMNASYHLEALLPRFFMRYPMGLPNWGRGHMKAILKTLLDPDYHGRLSRFNRLLELSIQETFRVRYCLATESGRGAIKLALLAMDLDPGDGVVLPAFTCLSILNTVLELGLQPVLADVGSDLQLDTRSVERVIDANTKVVIVTHLFGGLAPMKELQAIARERSVRLLDDAAQAIGLQGDEAYAGAGGDAGIFSFSAFKPVSGLKSGGALVTDDKELYERAKRLREDRWEPFTRKEIVKTLLKTRFRRFFYLPFLLTRRSQQKNGNGKSCPKPSNAAVKTISPLDASIVYPQIGRIASLRNELYPRAKLLHSRIEGTALPVKNFTTWPYVGFPRWAVQIADDNSPGQYEELFRHLLSRGIEVQVTYRPLHTYLKEWKIPVKGEYRRSERISNKIMCLPLGRNINVSYLLRRMEQFG